jgi:hypothetical protein
LVPNGIETGVVDDDGQVKVLPVAIVPATDGRGAGHATSGDPFVKGAEPWNLNRCGQEA